MSIVLTRIDNRLIHGQVLEAWLPYTHADCIVVANDEVAGLIKSRKLDALRLLILFSSSEDACRAHAAGISFSKLNLGNMHAGKDKVKLSCTIAIDREDIENLTKLEEQGVRIVSQCVPQDFEQSWHKLIRNWQEPYAK